MTNAIFERHLDASPLSRPLFCIAAALAWASLVVGCGGDLHGAPEDGGTPGSDAYTTDTSADATATAPSNDASLDATPDGTLPDGNLLDDASVTADGADSSAPAFDAGADAVSDANTDDGGDTSTVVLAADDMTNAAIAIDDTNVYFTTADAGVSGVPRTGGPTFVVAQPSAGTIIRLYLETGILYGDPCCNPYSSLLSVPATARNAPATFLGSFGNDVTDFAITGNLVYGASQFGEINTLPATADAGTFSVFFSGLADSGIADWISIQLDAENGTLDGLEDSTGRIDRIPLDGGAMTSITVATNAVVMAIHGDTMYWVTGPECYDTEPDAGCIPALYASALDGSNASLVASGPWPFESSYDAEDCIGAITAKYVFLHVWGGIVRVTLATGESHLVYSYLGSDPTSVLSPGSIAADDDFLYVVDPTAGLVRLSN